MVLWPEPAWLLPLGSPQESHGETPVAKEDDVAAGILAECGTIQSTQGSLWGCTRTWCVTAMPAMKSVAASLKSSYESIGNDTIKILYTLYNP